MIQFGDWLPDQPSYMNAGVTVATNVAPAITGYRSVKSAVAYSNSADSTLLNVFSTKEDDGSSKTFAADAGKIYLHNAATNDLDDVSKAGTPAYDLTGDERWRFVQFGNVVIAAGGIGEELQKFELGTDTAFSDLAGTPPKADYIAIVRDFVFVGNADAGSGREPYKVYWSGFNDETSWTAGTDQSDFQQIVDCGRIQGIVGGEYATILLERGIVRATYSGPPLIFQFDKVEISQGCQAPGSICNVGHTVFYLSDDGFYSFDGARSTPIGVGKIDKWFLEEDFDATAKGKMTAAADPENQLIYWSYVSNSNTTGTPDRVLIYNYAVGKWSVADIAMDVLAPFFTSGYTVETLDNISTSLETLPASLDSSFYKGGQYLFGGGVGDKIASLSGDALQGTIVTGESAISVGNNAIITRVYPYHEGGTVEVSVGTRTTPTDNVTYGTAGTTNSAGFVPVRSHDRYHRVKMLISGEWKRTQGIDVEVRQVGRR